MQTTPQIRHLKSCLSNHFHYTFTADPWGRYLVLVPLYYLKDGSRSHSILALRFNYHYLWVQCFRFIKFLVPLLGSGNAKSVLEDFIFLSPLQLLFMPRIPPGELFNYNPDIERTFQERRRAQRALFAQLPPFSDFRKSSQHGRPIAWTTTAVRRTTT